MEGTVKFYNKVKGFGFIVTEGDGDVFVHATHTNGALLRDGQRVSFDLVDGPRGKQAHNVKAFETPSTV
jgi:cold shock protein